MNLSMVLLINALGKPSEASPFGWFVHNSEFPTPKAPVNTSAQYASMKVAVSFVNTCQSSWVNFGPFSFLKSLGVWGLCNLERLSPPKL